jgi:anti-anti-sigma regulatory factor
MNHQVEVTENFDCVVTRIEADGIDALVSAAFQAGESDISLRLVGVQGPVGAALAAADLDRTL